MPLILLALTLFPAWGADFYVKSLKAPLLPEAKNGVPPLSQLERGTKVEAGKPAGSFVAVKAAGQSGFINKLFLTDRPPEAKGSLLQQDIDISTKARRRASGFTSAAAARGLKEDSDEIFKTLGDDADGGAVKKVEAWTVAEAPAATFLSDPEAVLEGAP